MASMRRQAREILSPTAVQVAPVWNVLPDPDAFLAALEQDRAEMSVQPGEQALMPHGRLRAPSGRPIPRARRFIGPTACGLLTFHLHP